MCKPVDHFAHLEDDLDAVIEAPTTARPGELKDRPLVPEGHREKCRKCRGTGEFRAFGTGRVVGHCHACKGVGEVVFKQPATVRAALRAKSHTRKADREQANLDAFAAAHPDVWAWMNGSTFEFAVKMREALQKWGSLTDGQLNACKKAAAALAAAKAAGQARVANAVEIDTSKIEACFARAGAALKKPILRVPGFKIAVDKKGTGDPFVRDHGAYGESLYFGKISGGKFIPSRECTPEIEAKFRCTVADPQKAAIEYGRLTGHCGVCGIRLTDDKPGGSIERGIGPICAEKFGW